MALLAFQPAHQLEEQSRQADRPTRPAAYVLVALWRADRLLLVRVRDRDCWELPGGGVEPGESADEAAVRELREETGMELAPGALRLAGHATTALGAKQNVLTGALFTAEITESEEGTQEVAAVFTPNEEISEVRWWDGVETLPRLQTVDTYLAALTRPRS